MSKPDVLKVTKTFKNVASPTSAEDGKAIIYNNTTGQLEYGTVATGSGSETGIPLTEYTNIVTPTTGTTNIPIGISQYQVGDLLEVSMDNSLLYLTDNYTLNANGTSIDLVGFSTSGTNKFMFHVIKGNMLTADWSNIQNKPTIPTVNTTRSMLFYIDDVLKVETNAIGFIAPMNLTITEIRLAVDTAPTGANLIIDINKNGTTLYTTQANRPTITVSGTSSTATLPDVLNIAIGDKISLDIDQIGSTVAGENLSVTIICTEVN